MAKKLLSFLGNNYYFWAIYKLGDEMAEPQRFVQASLAELICKKQGWGKDDSIHIFLTEGAKEANWIELPKNMEEIPKKGEVSPGIYDEYVRKYHGLEWVLKEILGKDSPIGIIPVTDVLTKLDKDKINEKTIWKIFEKVMSQIKDGDEIYFDITHSFRFLPLLAIIVLNYARVVKRDIKIGGIYYGAFESIGFANMVKTIPIEQRIAPIIDLTQFENLQRWTAGVDRFMGTGDASIIKSLVEERGEKDSEWGKLAGCMDDFSKSITTCRCRKITQKAKELKVAVENARSSINNTDKKEDKSEVPETKYSPMIPLLDKIDEKVIGFGNNDILNGLEAVKWCLAHNLTQQGYTILRELVTTWLAIQHYGNKEKEIYNRYKRSIFSDGLIYAIHKEKPEAEWKEHLRNNREKVETIKKIKGIGDLAKYFNNLCDQYRNDIDHCGCRRKPKPKEPRDLINDLHDRFCEIESFLGSHFKQQK